MQQYLDLLADVFHNGTDREDRTGVGTRSVFGRQLRCDLQQGFPLLTTKKVFTKGIVHELLWFLRGSSNAFELQREGVHIWDEWAGEDGELGPIYGVQWRSWPKYRDGHIDQISKLINEIQTNPNSRRLVVSAWNVAQIEEMALPPCHILMQFYVANNKLSCHLYQRSGDIFLGVPFNIASYALLTMMIAQVCDLELGDFVHSFGDLHLYHNHFEQAETQLSRRPKDLPTMKLNPQRRDLFSFVYSDFQLEGYEPYPAIKAPVAV